MFEKQERIAILILLVVLAICAAGTVMLEGMGKEPFATRYTQQTSEGSLVTWQGIVQQVTPVSSGARILTVSGVPVFLSSAAGGVQVQAGDQVVVYGKVQVFKGKREILVSDQADIEVTAGSQGKNLRS